MRIPISIKLILLVSLLLVVTTAFIADKSSHQFVEVLTDREKGGNYSSVTNRLRLVDSILYSMKDRVEVLGTMLAQKAQNNLSSSKDFEINFEKDRDIIALGIYKTNGNSEQRVAFEIKTEFLEPFHLPNSFVETALRYVHFPFHSVMEKNIELVNTSFPHAPPMITMGIPILQDEMGNVSHIAVASLSLDSLQKPFVEKTERTLFLTDRQGTVLAHQDEGLALSRINLASSPIVQKALADHNSIPQQTQFADPTTQKEQIGAYAKSSFGVIAFSQIELEKILEPARQVNRDAFLIAGEAIAVAFFISFLFSISLTSPIEKLADLIQVVARGNFDVQARLLVKSHDEVGDLATAFDKMTIGLKERDKVKSLFSKFHGSSVADDLINNDVTVGGQNRDVTVFFSDIRGFTSFSENRSPEQVVEMLNEYFSVMVSIINKHGGVVDKFIGDAIMAVWGAPKETPDDTRNALTACLEMRRALHILNSKRLESQEPAILIGMGLHSGRAISGTIGSEERMEYTVIGDTVNLTSRIEASTKAFGADLLVSETVASRLPDQFVFELGGTAEVKGKSEPLKLFKVRGFRKSDGTVEIIQTPYSDYEKGHVDKVKVA